MRPFPFEIGKELVVECLSQVDRGAKFALWLVHDHGDKQLIRFQSDAPDDSRLLLHLVGGPYDGADPYRLSEYGLSVNIRNVLRKGVTDTYKWQMAFVKTAKVA